MASRGLAVSAILALVALGACQKVAGPTESTHHSGRFEGVGVYTPSAAWADQEIAAPADFRGARLADDEAVIVVVDSITGEVRACGDLSGHCVRLNPWQAAALAAPTPLKRHDNQPPVDANATDATNATSADH